MNKYNPHKHHRRSIRLREYDYGQAGLYFITLCVDNRKNIFGTIEKGEMRRNELGEIANNEWQNTSEIRKNISLGTFIIMPNHFHAILQIDYQIATKEDNMGKFKSPSNTIGAIIRGYKGATTKKIKELIRNNPPSTGELQFAQSQSQSQSLATGELQFAPTPIAPSIDLSKSIWQRNYWEHIIRDQNAYNRITQYIINNPQKWENDKLNGGNGNIVMEPALEYNIEEWMI